MLAGNFWGGDLDPNERELIDRVLKFDNKEAIDRDIAYLFTVKGLDFNVLYYGQSPFYIACANGKFNLVQQFIEDGPLEAETGKPLIDAELRASGGETPVWAACRGGYVEIVKYLKDQRDVDLGSPSTDGRTPLWVAAHNGHFEVVKYLCAEEHDLTVRAPANSSRRALPSYLPNTHQPPAAAVCWVFCGAAVAVWHERSDAPNPWGDRVGEANAARATPFPSFLLPFAPSPRLNSECLIPLPRTRSYTARPTVQVAYGVGRQPGHYAGVSGQGDALVRCYCTYLTLVRACTCIGLVLSPLHVRAFLCCSCSAYSSAVLVLVVVVVVTWRFAR